MNHRWLFVGFTAAALFACGCGEKKSGGAAGAQPVDTERPPTTGRTDIESWLAAGHYKSWACEPEPHDRRKGSAHSKNRICSNSILSKHEGAGWPVDAAGVKELYDGSGTIVGYAVYRHVSEGTGGESWYWYERVGSSVEADGLGSEGDAKDTCVSCHEGAGQGGQTGHDLVFTQVK